MTPAFRNALVGADHEAAVAYWSVREWKKFAVHVWAGPDRRPTFERVLYIGATSAQRALQVAKHGTPHSFPARAQFAARLAGPRELGCDRTPVVPSSNDQQKGGA